MNICTSLTPVSTLLINNGSSESLSPFVMAMLHPVIVDPFQLMSAWFRGNGGSTPFSIKHGCEAWDIMGRDPNFNRVFDEGMASDSKFLMGFILEKCGDVFEGVRTLVDVGGGTGAAAAAISEAFPCIRCSVLELPHVVSSVSGDGIGGAAVEFISGDMFEYVPPADAVLLKWILHDWNDEDCVKILKKCKEAIPSREEGGKIIIIDMVVGSDDSFKDSTRAQFYMDILMLTVCVGAERNEQEWRNLFTEAGFKSYKIISGLGSRTVIELYP